MKRIAGVVITALLTVSCAWNRGLFAEVKQIPYARAGITGSSDPEENRLKLFEFHVKWLTGVEIVYQQLDEGLAGAYAMNERKIYIQEKLPFVERFHTLAHEAAHVVQPSGMTEIQGQVWAELVAFNVCRQWGLPKAAYKHKAVGYLSTVKGGIPGMIDQYAVDLNWAVTVLTGIVQEIY